MTSQWKLVPVRASEEMLKPACAIHAVGKPMSTKDERECPRFGSRRRGWSSMLAASPEPPDEVVEAMAAAFEERIAERWQDGLAAMRAALAAASEGKR